MHHNEKQYFNSLIETLHPFGDVLEVGFGSGTAAELIQKYHPRKHLILEADPVQASKAREWAKKHPTASILEESWRSALPGLGLFDCIFFGLPSSAIFYEKPFLKEGKQLLDEISEQLPEIAKIRYLDHDLDAFCANAGKGTKKQVARFLSELEQNGQISAEQRKKMREKYELEDLPPPEFQVKEGIDPMLLFLSECVKSHMRKGSRFSCYLNQSVSKSEDPLFFEAVMANPYLDYRETLIDGRLVMTIEKLG